MDTEGRWLTYGELAAIRGTKRASAIKLAQRERWPRQAGNDRSQTVRVLVPGEWLVSARDRPAEAQDEAGGMPMGFTVMLEAANRRADEAGKRAEAALALADKTLAQLAEERERVTDLHRELNAGRAAAQAAQAAAEELRQAAARERHRADERRATIEDLRAEAEAHARELAKAQHDAQAGQQAAAALRQAEAERKARGRLRRAWDGWRGR